MADWLAPLRRTPAAPAEVPTFDLTCECGQTHTGPRRRRHQQILCRECGSTLFVLPISPYPPPPERPKKKPTEARRRQRQAEAGDSISDSMREMPALAADRFGSWWHGLVVGIGGGFARLATGTADRIGRTGRAIWRQFTLINGIVAALLLVIGAAAAFMVEQRQRATAEATYREQTAAAEAALDDENIGAAAIALAEATAAADRLGLDDDPATRVRIAARELTAITNLSPETLPELLADLATRAFPNGHWAGPDARRLGRRWHVWEGPVVGGTLPMPLPVEGMSVELRVDDLPAVDRIEGDGPVVLAVQVADVARDEDSWTVRFDPDTAFLWQSMTTYRELGIPFTFGHEEARVRELLKRQAAWNGTPIEAFEEDAGRQDAGQDDAGQDDAGDADTANSGEAGNGDA